MAASRSNLGTYQLDELVKDLAALRAKGLERAADVDIPALRRCVAQLTDHQAGHLQLHHYELGLQAAMGEMGEGHASDCAAVLFGIAPHVRGLHPIELRKRATELHYDRAADRNSVDAFRKSHEPRILGALAAALLRALAARITPGNGTVTPSEGGSVGASALPVARLVVDQPEWRHRSLPVLLVEPEQPSRVRELTWSQFGQGVENLRGQIHHYGTNIDIDIAIGINEAGLMIATLLASASFSRCALGYVRTRSRGVSLRIDEDHTRLGPQLRTATAVLLCDYEVKTAPVLSSVCEYLYEAGLAAETPRYFAVMGALATEDPTRMPPGDSFDLGLLACYPVLEAARLADVFVGCLMASPGIDPPLGLR